METQAKGRLSAFAIRILAFGFRIHRQCISTSLRCVSMNLYRLLNELNKLNEPCSFELCSSFGPWHLSFLRCSPAAVGPLPPPLKKKWQPTKRIIRTLTTKPPAGDHPTYEKELLNPGENGDFYKTNHPSFALPVCRPSPFVRRSEKATKRIGPHSALRAPNVTALRIKKSLLAPENDSFAQNESIHSQAECVAGRRLAYEHELSGSGKQTILPKRIPTRNTESQGEDNYGFSP